MRTTLPFSFLLILMGLAAGCGDSRLTRDYIDAIPAGDSTDSFSFEGEYERRTTSCSGTCVGEVFGYTVTACDVGQVYDGDAEITLENGVLTIDTEDTVDLRYRGGLFSDGSFEIGAYGTQGGASIEVFAIAEGTWDGARFVGNGTALTEGSGLNCTSEHEYIVTPED